MHAARNTRSLLSVTWIVLVTSLVVSMARADQPRDWMIAAAPEGDRLNVDLLYPGLQLGYEHTTPIYGGVNALTVRGSNLLTAAFNDTRADVDLRMLVLTLGASVGYRDNWRAQIFGPGDPVDRAARRNVDNTGSFQGSTFDFGSEDWGYLEGRVGLSLPFNEHLVYSSTTALLFEDRAKRSLDWRNGVVRDPDLLTRSDHFILAHHRSFGGVGPLFQVLSYRLDGRRTTQLNYGFMFVGRPGFRRDHDLILFQMLFHFGDRLGGDDNRRFWGAHNIYSSANTLTSDNGPSLFGSSVPLTFLIVYRMVIPLGEAHRTPQGPDAREPFSE
ncbi:MAG: hypothetical protein PVI30_05710 [Myxococcales bacterium]|jgi:hypothetical protein